MRPRIPLTLVLLFLYLYTAWRPSTGAAQGPSGQPCPATTGSGGEFAPGWVLVGFADELAARRWTAERQAQESSGLSVDEVAPLPGVRRARVPEGEECPAAQRLLQDPQVLFAEPDYLAQAGADLTPADPDWGKQWGPAKINAPMAWALTTGSPQVGIAVIDTGVKTDHPDLAGKIWVNPGEIPGNGVDDDGNGKVDDIHGWHFFHSYTSNGYEPYEDPWVQDEAGHGTHVAGIAGAQANNQVGIAGIAWESPLMVVKVLDKYGNGWYSDIAAGIAYAVDNGARVINLSLGGEQASVTLCQAVQYAAARGALVVAAAGNTGGSVLYPAACLDALAVAATDSQDRRPAYSNYGDQIDLAAPGGGGADQGDCVWSTWYLGNYLSKCGTSMAAPHVSGTAALLLAHRPDLSAEDVVDLLTGTAQDIGRPGYDIYTGWGRLDAYRALTGVRRYSYFFPVVYP